MTQQILVPSLLRFPRGFSENAVKWALELFPAHKEIQRLARMAAMISPSSFGTRIFRAGVGGFSPLDASGLVAWYSFFEIATLFQDGARTTPVTVNDDPIGGVTDRSTGGNHPSQTLTARPLYKTNIQNGKSASFFDASNDYLLKSSSSAPIVAPLTVFCSFKASVLTDFMRFISVGSTAANGWMLGVSSQKILFTTTSVKDYSDSATLSANTTYIVIVTFNNDVNNTATIYLNNNAPTTVTHGAGANSGTQHLWIGANVIGTGLYNGYLFECGIYDNVLSAGNITLLKNYMNDQLAIY